MSSILKVGVFIPQFKWERMNLHSVNPKDHGVELVSVEIGDDLSSFDGIIHKFTYQLVDGHANDVQKILEYSKTRSNFIVIEPIEHINIFVDRLILQNFLKIHPLPSIVEYVEGLVLEENIQINFDFPMMIKSTMACGCDISHKIHIIHNQEQLNSIGKSSNLMVFPFIKHHGIVFKCYSLGHHNVMRHSTSIQIHEDSMILFDSQKPLPKSISGTTINEELINTIKPSMEEINLISESLRLSTGVNLIGFDLIRRESDNKICLVDFNYFPCFRGIDDIPGKLAQFIKSKF